MRRPITLNHPAKASAQKGFALFIVLMIMIVIALLVVTATQSYNTEQRISTNDADHKFATTLAEAALREGENHIYEIEDGKNHLLMIVLMVYVKRRRLVKIPTRLQQEQLLSTVLQALRHGFERMISALILKIERKQNALM